MRRLNVAIAERRDGIGPLIVAEEEKNVERPSLRQVRSRLCRRQTTEQGSDKQRDAFHGFFSSSNAVVLSLNFPEIGSTYAQRVPVHGIEMDFDLDHAAGIEERVAW
jgi:hypothetical protein